MGTWDRVKRELVQLIWRIDAPPRCMCWKCVLQRHEGSVVDFSTLPEIVEPAHNECFWCGMPTRDDQIYCSWRCHDECWEEYRQLKVSQSDANVHSAVAALEAQRREFGARYWPK